MSKRNWRRILLVKGTSKIKRRAKLGPGIGSQKKLNVSMGERKGKNRKRHPSSYWVCTDDRHWFGKRSL